MGRLATTMVSLCVNHLPTKAASVVLGRSVLPMSQLLKMGRGAVIPLDASEHDEVWILANNHPVARGEIEIREDRIAITVTRPADVYDFMAGAA